MIQIYPIHNKHEIQLKLYLVFLRYLNFGFRALSMASH